MNIKIIYSPHYGYACKDGEIEFFWRNSVVFKSDEDKIHCRNEIRVGTRAMIKNLQVIVARGIISANSLEFYTEDINGHQSEYT